MPSSSRSRAANVVTAPSPRAPATGAPTRPPARRPARRRRARTSTRRRRVVEARDVAPHRDDAPDERARSRTRTATVSPRCMQSRSDVGQRAVVLPALERGPRPLLLVGAPLGADRVGSGELRLVEHARRFEQIVDLACTARSGRDGTAAEAVATVVRMRPPASRRLRVALVVVASCSAPGLRGRRTQRVDARADRRDRTTDADDRQGRACSTCTSSTGRSTSAPGQNMIDTNKYRIPQPTEDGWIVGFSPTCSSPTARCRRST